MRRSLKPPRRQSRAQAVLGRQGREETRQLVRAQEALPCILLKEFDLAGGVPAFKAHGLLRVIEDAPQELNRAIRRSLPALPQLHVPRYDFLLGDAVERA